jgi:malonyl-CoA/methylmalonyl-CoA synthetase
MIWEERRPWNLNLQVIFWVMIRMEHFLHDLRATFSARASHEALVWKEGSFTFQDVDRLARCWASVLQAAGVAAGDRVAILTPEKLRFLMAHLGAMFSGAVSLPLNPRMTRDELLYFLEDSGARVVVAGDAEQPMLDSLRSELPELRAVLADSLPPDVASSGFREQAIDRDAPAFLLYSSGTTGRPKGIVHTHANLASSLHALRHCWRFTPDDVLVNVLPLFHIHGLSFAAHLSLLSGCSMLLEDVFHPRRTLDVISRGTVFMAIPTFYYSFLDRPEFRAAAQQWRNVRLFTCGSAPIRADVLPDLEQVLGQPVINRYGMTEAHVISSLPVDGPWPQGSVGVPLEGVELQLVKDDGVFAAPGEVGSVQLRGPNLFREYWRKPEATRAAFASGWFDTGDLGTRDLAGFLTLVGRKHDLIITSGFNVYPQVVERVLNECPGVKESAVLGVPDRKRGERVVAVVVPSDNSLTQGVLKAYLSDHLVDYQRPAQVLLRSALPRNAMGKILRHQLRDEFTDS